MLERYKLRYDDLRPSLRHRVARVFIRPICILILLAFPFYWFVAALIDTWPDAKNAMLQLLCVIINGIERQKETEQDAP